MLLTFFVRWSSRKRKLLRKFAAGSIGKNTEDIRDYVQCCEKCQRMNAKFMKSNATLHPIAVEPKV